MGWFERCLERIVAFYDVPMRAGDAARDWVHDERDMLSHMYRCR